MNAPRMAVLVILAVPLALGTPAPARAICLGNHVDPFEDGIIPSLLYSVDAGQGSVNETGGVTAISSPAGTTLGARLYTSPTRKLCGDFDVQVDWSLTDFTPPSSTRSRVAGLILEDGVGTTIIERYAQPVCCCNPSSQSYKAWFYNSDNCAGTTAWVATGDFSGKFRARRVGSTLTLSYWNGSGWTALKSGAWSTNDVRIGIGTWAPGGGSAPGTGHLANFDNLIIQSSGSPAPLTNPAMVGTLASVLGGAGALLASRRRRGA